MTGILVITGASRGIGYATAKEFLEKKYTVINLSRTPCALAGVKNITVDFTDLNWTIQVESFLKNIISYQQKICLVHNAYAYESDSVLNLSAENFSRILQANLVAPQQLNQLLLPLMHEHSSIIYIGSVLSFKAVANAASYATVKHAVIGLMRATCQDLAGKKIHTCCVCPGFTNTEMLRTHLGNRPDVLKSIEAQVTQQRLIEPKEIASLISYCAENPVINGAVLEASLGQVQR